MRSMIAGLLLLLTALPAQARHHRHHHVRHHHVPQGAVVAHPTGCPRVAFCGCGTAVRVFGAPIRSLWLAANWLRFRRAAPAPGMVAVRRHHVFAIVETRGRGRVLAYDPNSGGHLTRVHLRSLAGYTVVDPRQRI